jgi:hypothetical protein
MTWAIRARENQRKARLGSKENRAFYRRLAAIDEAQVGVFMALEKVFRMTSTRHVLPSRLHAAYEWTEAAGELSELRGLTGDALREYATESAGNAGECDVHDVRR